VSLRYKIYSVCSFLNVFGAETDSLGACGPTQGFNWESCHAGRWYESLRSEVDGLAADGFTALWLPPPSVSVSPQVCPPRHTPSRHKHRGLSIPCRRYPHPFRYTRTMNECIVWLIVCLSVLLSILNESFYVIIMTLGFSFFCFVASTAFSVRCFLIIRNSVISITIYIYTTVAGHAIPNKMDLDYKKNNSKMLLFYG
jgi:hypothetical protein